jgi:Nas2 N_terminal domain
MTNDRTLAAQTSKSDVTRADVLTLIRHKDELEADVKALHELLATVSQTVDRGTLMGLRSEKIHISFHRLHIEKLTETLFQQGNVGMNGPLLDSEGFPRNDIDVYSVRHARHRIICTYKKPSFIRDRSR